MKNKMGYLILNRTSIFLVASLLVASAAHAKRGDIDTVRMAKKPKVVKAQEAPVPQVADNAILLEGEPLPEVVGNSTEAPAEVVVAAPVEAPKPVDHFELHKERVQFVNDTLSRTNRIKGAVGAQKADVDNSQADLDAAKSARPGWFKRSMRAIGRGITYVPRQVAAGVSKTKVAVRNSNNRSREEELTRLRAERTRLEKESAGRSVDGMRSQLGKKLAEGQNSDVSKRETAIQERIAKINLREAELQGKIESANSKNDLSKDYIARMTAKKGGSAEVAQQIKDARQRNSTALQKYNKVKGAMTAAERGEKLALMMKELEDERIARHQDLDKKDLTEDRRAELLKGREEMNSDIVSVKAEIDSLGLPALEQRLGPQAQGAAQLASTAAGAKALSVNIPVVGGPTVPAAAAGSARPTRRSLHYSVDANGNEVERPAEVERSDSGAGAGNGKPVSSGSAAERPAVPSAVAQEPYVNHCAGPSCLTVQAADDNGVFGAGASHCP